MINEIYQLPINNFCLFFSIQQSTPTVFYITFQGFRKGRVQYDPPAPFFFHLRVFIGSGWPMNSMIKSKSNNYIKKKSKSNKLN